MRGRAREIAPHVTLWRDAQAAPQVFVPLIAWGVREVALLTAVRGRSRHEALGRWRLSG